MRCKMKAMIVDMCILSHKTQCFWDVRTSGGRRRGQKEGFARNYTVSIYIYIGVYVLNGPSKVMR